MGKDIQIKQEESNLKRKPEQDIEKLKQQLGQKNLSKVLITGDQDLQIVNKWWEKDDDSNDEQKWQYLEHHGVLFPPNYTKHNVKPLYDGKPIELTDQQEEMASYWAQSMGTDWEQKQLYIKNFTTMFLGTFKEKMNFDKFDFTPIKQFQQETKEKQKEKTQEEKKQLKIEREKRDQYYGYAFIDNVKEKIGGYLIEAPTLFKGRGDHPKAGFMKARIMPEDITINVANNAPIPKCEMPGHCWKDIVHNNEVTWLAYYKDDTINVNYKYIFLSASSKFKGINDRKKYEKARKLKGMIDVIRNNYEKKMQSSKSLDKQLGTATYLIDKLALRVGNEKSEDEADTVGTCSLRVEHIKLEDNFNITFDFLGKDSMRYFNTVQLDELPYKNIKEFIKNKSEEADLFDLISASSLNDYLKQLMEGLSAKVFRTYNASATLQNELFKTDISKLTLDQKVQFYDEANKSVAILCNHQKTVSKNFEVQKEKLEQKITIYNDYVDQLKAHAKKFKNSKQVQSDEKLIRLQENVKNLPKEEDIKKNFFSMVFPSSLEKTQTLIQQYTNKIDKQQILVQQKQDNKSIALGTSKLNYNDPRISVVWCKLNEVPIEKVFSKALRTKFPWAMPIEMEWRF